MSRAAPPPMPTTMPQTNGLGVASFVVSLVGLLGTGGLLCPVGAVMGLVAMSRQPHGFAVAGLVIGLLGMCGWIIAIFVAGVAILAAFGIAIATIALSDQERVEITRDMASIAFAVSRYEDDNRYLPATLDILELRSSTLIDPWGEQYRYDFIEEKPGYDLTSAGEDRSYGTEDDLKLSTLGERWTAGGFGIDVKEDDDGGRVTINFGPATLEAEGEDDHGRVTIDLGHRVIEIVGDESGGSIDLDADSTAEAASAPAEAPPETPDG